MEIVDKTVFRTVNWIIESDNDTYRIQLQEDLTEDYWYISGEEEGVVNEKSELGQSLIKLCLDSEK